MEIKVAKTAGFCFGVKRAMDMVYAQVGKPNVHTYGPIVHNDEVVKELEQDGIFALNSVEELKQKKEGTIIIRAHGVDKETYDIIGENKLQVIDATCPFVRKIHKIVMEESKKGHEIIIIGNKNHPEVQGIKGWSLTEPTIIESTEEMLSFESKSQNKLSIVSQTTFNYNKFQELVEKISKTRYDITVLNTICNATQERQVEAKEIASRVDAMIVIGDRNSSNTQKLYEICRGECPNTVYIQTLDDLNPESVRSACNVGITAGASTPNNIIEEVHTNVRIKF